MPPKKKRKTEVEALALDTVPVEQTESPKHHKHFYFPDGNLILQVEDVLFNVHSSVLCQDDTTGFWAVLSESDSSRDDSPFVLEQVDVWKFEALLDVLYPRTHFMQQFNFRRWKAIIHLAKKWSMELVLGSAKIALTSFIDVGPTKTVYLCGLSTVELLTLAQTHPDLFQEKDIRKLFTLLFDSQQCLPVKEAGILGGTAVALVAAARESKNLDKHFRSYMRFIRNPNSEWWKTPNTTTAAAPTQ